MMNPKDWSLHPSCEKARQIAEKDGSRIGHELDTLDVFVVSGLLETEIFVFAFVGLTVFERFVAIASVLFGMRVESHFFDSDFQG